MNMNTTSIPGGIVGGGGEEGGGVRGCAGNVAAVESSCDAAAAVAASPATPHTDCDMSRMPESPLRKPGHRRALSDIIGLPDDLDLGAPGSAGDGPAMSDENEEELFSMFLDVEKLNSRCGASESESSAGGGGGETTTTQASAAAPGAAGLRPKHHQRHSMDASSSIDTEHLFGTSAMDGVSPAEAKKAMSAAKLAELALIDPKKAKSELKIRLQSTEQQVHLQDDLNEALKSELQRLKMATGQMVNGGGLAMNFGSSPHPFGTNQQVFHHNQAMPPPFLAMQQHPNQPLHPLQAQQLQQAALNLNMKGPVPAPNQWQWGDAWSKSSSS
nr:unnamed protein product [Digitaria exilis]